MVAKISEMTVNIRKKKNTKVFLLQLIFILQY